MVERPGGAVPRRTGLVLAYGVTTSLLLHTVAGDLPWVSRTLAGLASSIPEEVRVVEDPVMFAVLGVSLLGTIVAIGSFLVAHRTGTGFGIQCTGTVAWIVFPYSDVPWAAALGAPANQTYQAPGGVWILAGLMVVMATVEVGLSARDRILAHVDRLGLASQPEELARVRSGNHAWLVASMLLGILVALVYHALGPLTSGWLTDPHLVWVPALTGLVAGTALWLWARR